jgi:hypothetical protein
MNNDRDIKGKHTERKIKETVEPVSDFSWMDLSRFEGVRDRIETTGACVVSCRMLLSDAIK